MAEKGSAKLLDIRKTTLFGKHLDWQVALFKEPNRLLQAKLFDIAGRSRAGFGSEGLGLHSTQDLECRRAPSLFPHTEYKHLHIDTGDLLAPISQKGRGVPRWTDNELK